MPDTLYLPPLTESDTTVKVTPEQFYLLNMLTAQYSGGQMDDNTYGKLCRQVCSALKLGVVNTLEVYQPSAPKVGTDLDITDIKIQTIDNKKNAKTS